MQRRVIARDQVLPGDRERRDDHERRRRLVEQPVRRRRRHRPPEVVRAIGSAPDEPFSQIYVTLISALNSAESEILLTNAYFVPDPQLMKSLIDAVEHVFTLSFALDQLRRNLADLDRCVAEAARWH